MTPSTVTNLSEAWSAPGSCGSEPIVSGNRLYCTVSSSSSVGVRAIDTGSGAVVWERALASNPFIPWIQPVAFSGEELWVGHITDSRGFSLTVLDPATGDTVRSESTSVPLTPFVTADGRVANVEGDPATLIQTLVVRDRSTGATLWAHAFPGGDSSGASAPTLADGRIYTSKGSTIEAFDAGCSTSSCDPVWAQDLAGTNDGPLRSLVAGPDGEVFAVADGQAADGAARGRLFVFDGATGNFLWDQSYYGDCVPFGDFCSSGGITGVAVHGDTIFVSGFRDAVDGARRESLTAYSAAGCDGHSCSRWSAPVQGSVIIGGSVVYVGHGTSVDAYDVDGCGNPVCSPLASVALPHTFSRMSVARGKLFVQTSDDTGEALVAFTSTIA